MKSRISDLYDFQIVEIKEFEKKFEVDEEKINKEIRVVSNKYIKWKDVDFVDAGDIVSLSLKSDNKKYNRDNLKVCIGAGLFNLELEKAALGMRNNEFKTLHLEEGTIFLKIENISRKVVSEVTDEMIENLQINNVNNLKQFKEYLILEQKREVLNEDSYIPINYVIDKVIDNSDFILKKEDWEMIIKTELERCDKLAKQDGLDIKKMTAEEFNGRIPVSSYHELVSMLQDEAWNKLLKVLIGKHYADNDGFVVNKISYEEYIKDYAKYWNVTKEDAYESNAYEYYELSTYEGYFYNKVKKYVEERILVEV